MVSLILQIQLLNHLISSKIFPWAKCGLNQKQKIPQASVFRCSREIVVEIIGFEPMTSCMPCKRSSQLSYTPISCANISMSRG